jgi:predicted phosphoribosyltransferase
VVVAVPVGPAGVGRQLQPDADRVVVLHTPSDFSAVGRFYVDFTQTSPEDVVELLRLARAEVRDP